MFPIQSTDERYKMTMYLQVWKLLARSQDRQAVELVIGKIKALQ
jgi:hypothetical protein